MVINIPSEEEWINETRTFNQDNAYKATDFCPNLLDGDQSTTIKVNWQVNVCTITYSPNGGVFNNNATDTVQTCNYNPNGNCTDNMRNALGSGGYYYATRDGYNIPSGSEWTNGTKTFNQDNAYKATDFCPNLKNGNQSTTIKVNWMAKTIKVTFNKNDGSSSPETKTETFTYGKKGQEFSQTFTRTGYELVGWAETKSATAKEYNTNSVVKDNWINRTESPITLYAVWEPATKLTATFKVQDTKAATISSTTASCTTGTTNCKIKLPTATAKTGYEVVGWSKTKNVATSTNKSGDEVSISSNTTYYLITRNKTPYSIKFYSNGSLNSDTTKSCYLYNGATTCTITTPEIKPKTGFTVIGWSRVDYDDDDYDVKSNGTKEIWTNISLYAKTKSSKVYTATFHSNGSETSDSTRKCQLYNGKTKCKITTPTIKAKTGFTVILYAKTKGTT